MKNRLTATVTFQNTDHPQWESPCDKQTDDPLLTHVSTVHVGTIVTTRTPDSLMDHLEAAKSAAVDSQDFEFAARIRDLMSERS
jgi:excinuclease UvrABC nuclease subunit